MRNKEEKKENIKVWKLGVSVKNRKEGRKILRIGEE